jgi:hypothetical protein
MKRWFLRLATVLCAFSALSFATVANANRYTDWWWNPNQSGQGLNIGQQFDAASGRDVLFVAWFTYDNGRTDPSLPAGKGGSMWLSLSGALDANNSLTGDLLLFDGPALGTVYDPAKVSNTKVGTATLRFRTLTTGTFDWEVAGVRGTMDIQRFTFATAVWAGDYRTMCVGGSDCPNGSSNYAVSTISKLRYDGTTLSSTDEYTGGKICTHTARVSGADFFGSVMKVLGTYSCNDGDAGRWESNILFDRSDTQVVLVRRDTMTRTIGNCITRQTLAGPTLLR